MNVKSAVINPVKGKKSPVTGEVAILAATLPDVNTILHRGKIQASDSLEILMTRIFPSEKNNTGITVAGPFTGAPHAAMILENLIVWGVTKVIFIGWCGAVSPAVRTGDVIIPHGAFSDEGTSAHYQNSRECVPASPILSDKANCFFETQNIKAHTDPVWTTDAIYRETIEKIDYYQKKGASGVEMEAAAIFSIALFRQIQACAVLTVSDEVSSYVWSPGFGTTAFRKKRKKTAETVFSFAQQLNKSITNNQS